MIESRYNTPDTSDRRDDETWGQYWDRKRHERHGVPCQYGCVLCRNEHYLKRKQDLVFPELSEVNSSASNRSWVRDRLRRTNPELAATIDRVISTQTLCLVCGESLRRESA